MAHNHHPAARGGVGWLHRTITLALAFIPLVGVIGLRVHVADADGPSATSATGDEPGEPPGPAPEPPPRQTVEFTWTMPNRFGTDVNDDGLVDYFTTSDYCSEDLYDSCGTHLPTSPFEIDPPNWHVDLDACRSLLADTPDAAFDWQIIRGAGEISGGPGCGDFDLTVAAEGTYTLELTVSGSLGSATVTADVVVQDWLIVSLGDSFGSGEGNPDIPNPGPGIREGAWEDHRCHRSAAAGSAQAALVLENADPRTSVTFIHLACSGAEALNGLLRPYAGVPTTWEAKYMGMLPPQITKARHMIRDREVDALYLSIGGNDAGFGRIVMSCMALSVCNPAYQGLWPGAVMPDLGIVSGTCMTALLIPPPAGEVIAAICVPALINLLHDFAGDNAEHWFQQGLLGSDDPEHPGLANLYDQLDTALHATATGPNGEPFLGLPASFSNRVFISEYVDATQDDDGSYCPTGDPLTPLSDIRIPGISEKENEWVDLVVERQLNETVAEAARVHGWNLVGGIHDRFATHGLCADDTYMRGVLPESFLLQGDINAASHPNDKGHQVYRDRILSTILPTLYPVNPGEPPADLDIRGGRGVRTWIGTHSPRAPMQAPIADAGGPYTLAEGATVTATNSSYDDGPLASVWSTNDANVATVSPASAATPTITGIDDGQATLTLAVSDDGDADAEATDTATVTVTNVAPTVGALAVPMSPTPVGATIAATSSYADPGTADAHTLTWAWGDGTTTTQARDAGRQGTVSAAHTYARSGVYQVSVTADDHDGGVTSSATEYVVVFDPSSGFVTGGGVIDSPAGALTSDPTSAGRAAFAFVAKYQKGATTPTGATQFRYHASDFTVVSTSYDWLVVSGAKAQYKGLATVNGQPGYGFMLTALDGGLKQGGGPDRLRLKVWEISTGAVVYDNQGGADTADPALAITGGQITISRP